LCVGGCFGTGWRRVIGGWRTLTNKPTVTIDTATEVDLEKYLLSQGWVAPQSNLFREHPAPIYLPPKIQAKM
jgi:hypothetical protein